MKPTALKVLSAAAIMMLAGPLVTGPNGHGTQFGVPIPTITGPEQAQAFVNARD